MERPPGSNSDLRLVQQENQTDERQQHEYPHQRDDDDLAPHRPVRPLPFPERRRRPAPSNTVKPGSEEHQVEQTHHWSNRQERPVVEAMPYRHAMQRYSDREQRGDDADWPQPHVPGPAPASWSASACLQSLRPPAHLEYSLDADRSDGRVCWIDGSQREPALQDLGDAAPHLLAFVIDAHQVTRPDIELVI